MLRSGYHRTMPTLPARDAAASRLLVIGAVFFVWSAVIAVRLFDLQVLRADYYSGVAAKAQATYRELTPERGLVYMRETGNLYPIVSNRDYYLVYADPRQVTDPGQVVDTLTSVLGLSQDEWPAVAAKLARRNDPYEPLRHKVTLDQVKKIRAAGLPGIRDVPVAYRYYPEPAFGGQLLGFVGFAEERQVGRYGLEGYFERELAGTIGSLRSVGDAFGRPLAIGERQLSAAENGESLVLTIDRTTQLQACEVLRTGITSFAAEGGTIIVQRPATGELLAMCSLPNFDPESFQDVADPSVYNNPAIFTAYEPGSVFKAITMAAALDRGLVQPQDTYDDTGEIGLASGGKIRNADLKAHGVQTMVQVLEKSLNTGAVYVARKLGRDQFRAYVKDFGFGARTGITLETEVAGDISPLDRRGEIYTMTASFGQGITVTPLQLVAAFGALANGGTLMQPYLVSEHIRPDGTVVAVQPQPIRQVVAPRTASTISGMLVQAVEGVYDHKAKLAGYYVAGKTGTAQIASPDGGYGLDVHHTFVSYFPASHPEFVVLVKLDRPTKVKHAADSTTVLFHQLAEFLVDYYQIPPQR